MKKNLAMLAALITMGTSGVYAQPGALDPTFDTDGKVTTIFSWCEGRAMAIQADGKIVAAGTVMSSDDIGVARYNPDGSLDPSFGIGGTTTFDAGFAGIDVVRDIAIQADGKIVIVGALGAYASIVRIEPNGTPDPVFGFGGLNFVDADNDSGTNDMFLGVTIQPDGKIVAVGHSGISQSLIQGFIMRFNTDGTSDTGFDLDGYLVQDYSPLFSSVRYTDVALQPDNRIVVVGSGFDGVNNNLLLARYDISGILDNTFDGDGTLFGPIGIGSLFGVAIQPDGKIVATGSNFGAPDEDGLILRVNPDGSSDAGFGTNGKTTVAMGSLVIDVFYRCAIQPDGKIVTAGTSNTDFAVARFNDNGTLDAGFDTDGYNVVDMGGTDYGFDMALQADGAIVVAGASTDLSVARFLGGGGNAPEINLQGNAINIASGSNAYAIANNTQMAVCSGGGNATSRPFVIQNTGTADLTVSNLSSSNPNFSVTGGNLPIVIPAGGSATITVAYVAQNNASVTTTITVSSDDSDEAAYTFGVMGMTNPNIYNTFSITKPLCYGTCTGTATINVTGGAGGFTYMWSANANSQTTQTATGLCQGVYKVTMTDVMGCSVVRQYISVANPPQLAVVTTSAGANCMSADGMASAGVTGGAAPYVYAWSNGGSTGMITGLQAGTYTVTVTDANGCTAVKNAYVGSSCFTAIATPTHINTCTNTCTGSAMAQATGGVQPYSFVWSNGATTQTVTGLCKASYTVTATDANGATATASVSINFTPLSVTATTTPISCNGICDGTATALPTGAQAPYTYQWSTTANSQTTQTASGLCFGTYNVTVTSANGCSVVKKYINVYQPPAISLTMGSAPSSCQIDGIAYVSPSNGVAPYAYAWSNAGTTNTITGLQAGTYTVTVTDANGCMKSKSVTVANSCGAKPTEDTDLNADIALMEEESVIADDTELSDDINEALRLNDFSAVDVFNVFPNPNNGQFTIDIQLAAETDARIRIQDALGRTLYEENLQGLFFRLPIDANQWTAGAYFVQLVSAQGQTTRKVVITK